MKYRECPLIGKIKEEICFDVCMVVDELAPERTISKEILEKEDYKKICQNCKYHNEE